MKKLMVSALAVCGMVALMGCKTSKTTTIGILEFITQDALEACRTGFVDELAAKGYKDNDKIKIDYQNPEANSSTQTTMAAKLARECDMVFGIATPSAVALKSAVDDADKFIPVIYSACTDPVGAKLITSVTDHANVIGTSDAGPTAKNIDLFPKFKDSTNKDITKIGILYSTGESNSIVQKKEVQAEADKLGITLVDGGVADSTLIASTLNKMIADGIQGLFVPTDNAVAAAMSSLKETLTDKKILTVCADSSETTNGGSLGYSVSYSDLGKTTADMVAKLLGGTDIKDITCSLSSTFPLTVNQDFFTTTGISLPTDIPTSATLD